MNPARPRLLLALAALVLPGLIPPAAAQAPAAPATTTPPPAPPPAAYQLAKADTIRIEVYQEPDLGTDARIDENGTVRLPLINTLRVAGLTLPEAEAAIEAAFREGEFLRRAHVTVRILAYAPREVMISGQVRSPGNYALPAEGGLTIVDLIVRAGGLTELARGTAVRTRVDAAGTKHTRTIDAADLLRGKGNAKAPELVLQPGDIVFVPERLF